MLRYNKLLLLLRHRDERLSKNIDIHIRNKAIVVDDRRFSLARNCVVRRWESETLK